MEYVNEMMDTIETDETVETEFEIEAKGFSWKKLALGSACVGAGTAILTVGIALPVVKKGAVTVKNTVGRGVGFVREEIARFKEKETETEETEEKETKEKEEEKETKKKGKKKRK